jgi:hypothetical protein
MAERSDRPMEAHTDVNKYPRTTYECGNHISGLDLESTPQLFYTYFYNHAHRLRLEKLL